MSTESTESTRAQSFARRVVASALSLRGWPNPSTVPSEVREDVFAMLARHEHVFSRHFAAYSDPRIAALNIQQAEWASA